MVTRTGDREIGAVSGRVGMYANSYFFAAIINVSLLPIRNISIYSLSATDHIGISLREEQLELQL